MGFLRLILNVTPVDAYFMPALLRPNLFVLLEFLEVLETAGCRKKGMHQFSAPI
jgi:hypothetical protein